VIEVLRVLVTALVVGSLVTIVGYALAFAAAAVRTLFAARRGSPLADELDRVLAEILGAQPYGSVGSPSSSRPDFPTL
jgi:hypothetical protein